MERVLCIIIGYVFGCIQTAYIIGRLYKKIDIRNYGSGNAGATNAMRVLGMRMGVLTLTVDALKAILAVVVTALIFGYSSKYLLLYAGIGVVLGHNYPFYMKFKGGKGVAATLGIVAAVDFRLLLLAGIPALILLLTLKYMSVASLTFMLLLPVVTAIFYIREPHGAEMVLLTLFFTASAFWRHRGNLKRLAKGTEVKMGQKVKIEDADRPDGASGGKL